MSCDGNRARFVAVAATDPAVCQAFGDDPARAQTILETIYDTASQRQDVPPVLADALTRVLFSQMKDQGITPPTHAADGMPKPAARQGYAVLAQTLLAARGGRAVPALAAQIAERTPRGSGARLGVAAAGVAPTLATATSRPVAPSTLTAPASVTIEVDGTTYYVSGGTLTAMKATVKAYAHTYGTYKPYDRSTKAWHLPGALARVQKALGGYHITTDKPTAATPATPPAGSSVLRHAIQVAIDEAPGTREDAMQNLVDTANDNPFAGTVSSILDRIGDISSRYTIQPGRDLADLQGHARAWMYRGHGADERPLQRALCGAALETLGASRCMLCGQWMIAVGVHSCPARAGTLPPGVPAPGGSAFLMSPSAPAGSVPPSVTACIKRRVTSLDAYGRSGRAILTDIANNTDAALDALAERAGTILDSLAYEVDQDTSGRRQVPVVYWSRVHYGAGTPATRNALAHAVLTALGADRCPTCGQWMGEAVHTCPSPAFGPDGYTGFGLDRYGISRAGTYADGTPAPERTTIGDAAQDVYGIDDPIANAEMADLWGRIASGVAGHRCQIVLREGEGFATNMQGTIYADPYPLGRDADPRHNLLVTKAGIYHEIGHELTTPPEDWAYLLEVANGTQDIPGIDTGRQSITKLYNIIEDGRMERDMSRRFVGVAETLEAQCAIYPRWGEQVGAGVPLGEEVVWPILYTALPYFRVRDEVRAAMTPEGRALFEELEPIALRGAQGTPDDSLAATIEITRRLEAAGVLDIPETSATAPPPPSADTTPRSGPPPGSESPSGGESGGEHGQQDGESGGKQGGESGGEQDGEQSGKQGGEQGGKQGGEQGQQGGEQGGDAEENGKPGGGGPKDPNAQERESSVSGGSGDVADTRVDAPMTTERLTNILNDLEAQAVGTMERAAAQQARNPDMFGKSLHAPLTGNTAAHHSSSSTTPTGSRQRYLAPDGSVAAVLTATPTETHAGSVRVLESRRPAQQEISGRLARRLDSIRQETITRVRMQTEGRIDRRRFPAALAGRSDIRTRTGVTSETGMAVSILLDQSGSMYNHIRENNVYDATCIIGQALEQLDVPYEVRGHGGSSTQYKAMDDATLDPRRAARLTQDDTGLNAVTAPVVGLATTALRATPDANKLIVNVMDGDMGDHAETVAQYQATRTQGIVTFGVFLGEPDAGQQQRMTELFGVNSWRPIASLTELPDVVGQRIADIFDQIGED